MSWVVVQLPKEEREREKCSTTNCWECIGIAESHKFHSQVRRNACCLSKHSSLSIMKAESLVQSSSSHSLYSTMIRLEGSIFNPSIVLLLTSWFISNAVIVLSLYSTWLTIYLWWSGTCIYMASFCNSARELTMREIPSRYYYWTSLFFFKWCITPIHHNVWAGSSSHHNLY